MLRLLAALLMAAATIHGIAISHQDLEGGNRTCDGRSSCANTELNGVMAEVDWNKKVCMCDHDCGPYGNCCSDTVTEQEQEIINFECVHLRDYDGIYMKSECLPSWEGSETRKLCESPSVNRDSIEYFPVTSEATNVTYKNIYCALCNGESILFQWKMQVECKTVASDSSLTDVDVTSLLQFDNQDKKWVIFYYGTFHKCAVYPVIPERLLPQVRQCIPKLVRSCDKSWIGEEVRSLCESYTSVVYYGENPFRNLHCAICNNVPAERLKCFGPSTEILLYPLDPYLSVTIDFPRGLKLDQVEPCRDDKAFCKIFRKSRQAMGKPVSQLFSFSDYYSGILKNIEEIINSSTSIANNAVKYSRIRVNVF